jgi:hypothetical protein
MFGAFPGEVKLTAVRSPVAASVAYASPLRPGLCRCAHLAFRALGEFSGALATVGVIRYGRCPSGLCGGLNLRDQFNDLDVIGEHPPWLRSYR